MGATKTSHYSKETMQMAKIANALAHPARITIVKLLVEKVIVRNKELHKILGLSDVTVHHHMKKLIAANIVKFQYITHEYEVSLIPEQLEELNYYLKQ
jgi:DNA-binding transcriptional ArsR family regulator